MEFGNGSWEVGRESGDVCGWCIEGNLGNKNWLAWLLDEGDKFYFKFLKTLASLNTTPLNWSYVLLFKKEDWVMVGPILKTQVATSSDYDILVSLSSFFFYQESTVVIRVSLVQCYWKWWWTLWSVCLIKIGKEKPKKGKYVLDGIFAGRVYTAYIQYLLPKVSKDWKTLPPIEFFFNQNQSFIFYG